MTDKEIILRCAAEAGIRVGRYMPHMEAWKEMSTGKTYDPLRDDAQCMELIKRFKLRIDFDQERLDPEDGPVWYAQSFDTARNRWNEPAEEPTLNRAVCLCVARMSA